MKMRKNIFLFLIMFFFVTFKVGYSQNKTRVLVLPLDTTEIGSEYHKTQIENIRNLEFNSLYNFIRLLPFAEIPSELDIRTAESANIDEIASKFDADIVIYGKLNFSGNTETPQAELLLKIRSAKKQKDIFVKKYKSAIDLDIFDAMDRIVNDTISAAFKIIPRFAVVNFNGFKILGDSYSLYANNKIISKITNSDFELSMKILAGQKYNFMIIRDRDKSIVVNRSFTLKEHEVTNISYTATGTLKINPVAGKEAGEKYNILLDGERVKEGDEISNLTSHDEHTIIVSSLLNKIIYKKSFNIKDGEFKTITPDVSGKKLYFRFYALGSSFGGAGIDLALSPKFFIGLDGGYALATHTNINVSVSVVSVYIDTGYYFLGNKNKDFNISAAIGGGVYFALPADRWHFISSTQNLSPVTRLYIQAGWKLFYLRSGLVADFISDINYGPYLSLGIKL
ncbi:MAG: hypothetical protein D6707_04860 [Bacteroidetes bacterium]|nr:MAG: hypothetical protein D6707_04860 [Bacteroidota bacterium]